MFAQINMVIRKTDNSTISIPISNIDSVYFEESSVLTDIDGNTYQVVTIGEQCWMAENLKVTHYPNGDAIPTITDKNGNNSTDDEWGSLADNNTDDAVCFYNDNKNSEGSVYGALYTYAAAIGDNWTKDNANNQGVCPDGWHLPTDAEWTRLVDFLGGAAVAGGKMKETGTSHWSDPNTGATNESGFSALPGGYRGSGPFNAINVSAVWWSATSIDNINSVRRAIGNNGTIVQKGSRHKSFGFSVRCVKN